MPAAPSADPAQPYPHQAFYTARQILTVSPVTPDDYRRLLIGLGPVRNAWMFCKQCACDVVYYAWCARDRQVAGFAKQAPDARRIDVQGMLEVLLELEADPVSGDLNDAKVESKASLAGADGKARALELELRFPEWELTQPAGWSAFLAQGATVAVRLLSLGATRTYDVMSDPGLDEAGRDGYLREHWNGAFYLTYEVELAGAVKIGIRGVALHLFGDNPARVAATVAALRDLLVDAGEGGAIARYRAKVRKAAAALADVWSTLAAWRNLDEDFCRVGAVRIEDVAVCADIEVAADADIELVQAQAWFRIEQYMNPPVRHYSLQEMLDSGMPVEEIFNGPMPQDGFLRQDELAAAGLKSVLRNSDLINLLMDIDGVVAVGGLLLSKYDDEGELIKGAADPALNNGMLLFGLAAVPGRPASAAPVLQALTVPLYEERLAFPGAQG
jgi:transposase